MGQFSWQAKEDGEGGDTPKPTIQRRGQSADAVDELKITLHQRLIEELDPTKLQGLEPDKAREAVVVAARTLISQEMPGIVGGVRDDLIAGVADEVLGLGPIEGLLNEPAVSEIMVNAPDEVFYEKEGRLYISSGSFRDNAHIMRIIEGIGAPLGRRDEEN